VSNVSKSRRELFLNQLAACAAAYGWDGDFVEVQAFVTTVATKLGLPVPECLETCPDVDETKDAALWQTALDSIDASSEETKP